MADDILANSSSTISASILPRPSPPYSSGTLMPKKPISPYLRMSSWVGGEASVSQICAASGNSDFAKSLAVC